MPAYEALWGPLTWRLILGELHFWRNLHPTNPTPSISGFQTDAKNAKRTCKRVTIVSRHAKLERQSLSKPTRSTLFELRQKEAIRRQWYIYIYMNMCICIHNIDACAATRWKDIACANLESLLRLLSSLPPGPHPGYFYQDTAFKSLKWSN